MTKKILLSTLTITGLLLFGCGSSDTKKATSIAQTPAPTKAPEKTPKPTKAPVKTPAPTSTPTPTPTPTATPTPTPTATPIPTNLIGAWSSCINYEDNASKKYSINESLTFLKNNMIIEEGKIFNDFNCSNNTKLIYQIKILSEYTIGEKTHYSNDKNATELDTVIVGYEIIKNETNYLTEAPKIGEENYSMYNVDHNKLYTSTEDKAKKFDGSSPDKRENTFNSDYYIRDNHK